MMRKETDSKRFWVEAAVAALVCAGLMLWLLSAYPHLGGFDSYYHAKMALLVPSHGFVDAFPWMYWTDFRSHFVNHYYGFHALLSPWVHAGRVLYGNPMVGAKIFSVFGMALLGALTYGLLRIRKVPAAWLWVCLLAVAPWHFWLRMSYTRAPLPNLVLLLLGLYVLLRRNRLGVLLTAFFAVHLYSGGFFFVGIPLALLVAHVLCGTLNKRLIVVLALVGLGMALALLTSPYFPQNLRFLWGEAFAMVVGQASHTGSEWEPYDAWFFARTCLPFIGIWVLCLARRLVSKEALDGDGLALLFLQLGFFFMAAKSRHFIEYWPPFALLNMADMAVPALQALTKHPLYQRAVLRWFLAALFVGLCLVGAGPGLRNAAKEAKPVYDHGALARTMDVLKEQSKEGELVFADDWDLFPYCFYYNHFNRYCWGLDPIYTSKPYPLLWARYEAIRDGKTPTRVRVGDDEPWHSVRLEDVRDHFRSRWVLVSSWHKALFGRLVERSDLFRLVHPPDWRKGQDPPPFALFVLKDS